jgi:hypothetical protein
VEAFTRELNAAGLPIPRSGALRFLVGLGLKRVEDKGIEQFIEWLKDAAVKAYGKGWDS